MAKSINSYVQVDRARTMGRKCHHCEEKIPVGDKYLHMNRNNHLYNLCGKCLLIFTAKVCEADPTVKGDALAELI